MTGESTCAGNSAQSAELAVLECGVKAPLLDVVSNRERRHDAAFHSAYGAHP